MTRKINKELFISKERAKYSQLYKQSVISEQFRLLRSGITYSRVGKDYQTIMITSPGHGDGKTTTVANLGIVLAQHDKKVMMIDADLRKGKLHQLFDINHSEGLIDLLARKASVEEAICLSNIPNLHIIPSGAITKTSYELLTEARIEEIVSILSTEYDMILFDTSPILYTAETQIIANICEASLLVLMSGKTLKEEAAKATTILQNSKAQLLGASLNGNQVRSKVYEFQQ